MQADRWVRLERLFAAALALPDGARAAFLDRGCGNDADLRSEIDSLLRSHDGSGFLDAAPRPPDIVEPHSSLPDGARLGAWRIGR